MNGIIPRERVLQAHQYHPLQEDDVIRPLRVRLTSNDHWQYDPFAC